MTFDRKEYNRVNAAKNREQVRAWRKANPERARMHSYNNYLRRKAAGYVYTKPEGANKAYYYANKEALKVARHLGIPVREARKLLIETGERNARHRHAAQPSGPTYGAV